MKLWGDLTVQGEVQGEKGQGESGRAQAGREGSFLVKGFGDLVKGWSNMMGDLVEGLGEN